MNYNNKNVENYIDDYYKVCTFLKIYSHIINPTRGQNIWPRSEIYPIQPPKPQNLMRGRRAFMRRKEANEIKTMA